MTLVKVSFLVLTFPLSLLQHQVSVKKKNDGRVGKPCRRNVGLSGAAELFCPAAFKEPADVIPDVTQAEEEYREQGRSVKKKTVVSGNYRL